jgi:diguanylate cyclase (GGDEF)-like protein
MSNVFSAFALYKIEYNQRSMFLQSKILHYFSEHDQLTGLLNRRAMKELLRRVWAHCIRERLPLSFAVIGIDCFTDYRKQYGQVSAERCLVQISRLLDNCVQRPLDFVASFSSEEFALVLPGCNQENAHKVLDRLRAELDELGIEHAGCCEAGKITLNIGLVSDYPDNRNADPETLLQKGDAAAFEAVRKGGNTMVAWQL